MYLQHFPVIMFFITNIFVHIRRYTPVTHSLCEFFRVPLSNAPLPYCAFVNIAYLPAFRVRLRFIIMTPSSARLFDA